jgi:(p)ppGpp synthase/HD superfamily hydrolase
MSSLEDVKKFAMERHGDQRYSSGPYSVHLAAVSAVLSRFGITDEKLHKAAWLHDVVEDTETTLEEVSSLFGEEVADLVYRVTNEEGKNRKERHAKTYPKIYESNDAITLKLADRIANTEQSVKENNVLLEMYKREYPQFKDMLFKSGSHDEMWKHLDTLI